MKRVISAGGSAKTLLVMAIGAAGFLWLGGQGVYTALTNRAPAVIGCADYLQQQRAEKWLLLKGCRLNMIRASYSHSSPSDTITRVYVPIRGAVTDSGRITAFVATR
jgi:hypothetical protein